MTPRERAMAEGLSAWIESLEEWHGTVGVSADECLAILREIGAFGVWRPIAEAPRTGDKVLLCDPDAGVVDGYWEDELHSDYDPDTDEVTYTGGWTDGSFSDHRYEIVQEYHPTHYMPLPEPPETDR